MTSRNTKRRSGKKESAESPSSSSEIDDLKAQIADMQLEVDILNETLNIVKKDPVES